jgi:hypothetical protein
MLLETEQKQDHQVQPVFQCRVIAVHKPGTYSQKARTLAFFLGLAFEETYKRDEPTIPGGIRTFPLVGLAGAMLYLAEPHWVLAFGTGLLAIGAWLYAFLRHEQSLGTGGEGHRLP